jgi:hypothetical protein
MEIDRLATVEVSRILIMIELECHLEMVSLSQQSYLRICLDAICLSNIKFMEIKLCEIEFLKLANQDDDEPTIFKCHFYCRGELSI